MPSQVGLTNGSDFHNQTEATPRSTSTERAPSSNPTSQARQHNHIATPSTLQSYPRYQIRPPFHYFHKIDSEQPKTRFNTTQNLSVWVDIHDSRPSREFLPLKLEPKTLLEILRRKTTTNTRFRFENDVNDVGLARGLYPRIDRDKGNKVVVLFLLFDWFLRRKWPENVFGAAAV